MNARTIIPKKNSRLESPEGQYLLLHDYEKKVIRKKRLRILVILDFMISLVYSIKPGPKGEPGALVIAFPKTKVYSLGFRTLNKEQMGCKVYWINTGCALSNRRFAII